LREGQGKGSICREPKTCKQTEGERVNRKSELHRRIGQFRPQRVERHSLAKDFPVSLKERRQTTPAAQRVSAKVGVDFRISTSRDLSDRKTGFGRKGALSWRRITLMGFSVLGRRGMRERQPVEGAVLSRYLQKLKQLDKVSASPRGISCGTRTTKVGKA